MVSGFHGAAPAGDRGEDEGVAGHLDADGGHLGAAAREVVAEQLAGQRVGGDVPALAGLGRLFDPLAALDDEVSDEPEVEQLVVDPLVALVRASGAVVFQRTATAVAVVRAIVIMLGLAQPAAEPRAALESDVERVEAVRADLAGLGLTEHRPDDPADVALVGHPGGLGELGHLEVAVQDPAERGVPLRGLVALGLPEEPAERLGSRRLVGACLAQDPRLAGDRVGPGVHLDAQRPAGKLLYVTLSCLHHGGNVGPRRPLVPRLIPQEGSIAFEKLA
jgi:hypothetical protein